MARIKLVTKAQVLECFKKYLSPDSPERARLSVRLYAQGRGKDTTEGGNEESKTTDEATGPEDSPETTARAKSIIEEAVEIEDVHAFKASLAATPGARPVKDFSEYEETDAKL